MEKMKIVQKPAVEGLPKGYAVEYFGKIDEKNYFVILHLEKSRHPLDYIVAMGEAASLFYIQIDAIEKYQSGGLKRIKTARGEFLFPYHRRMERIGITFNRRYVDLI